MNKRSRQAALLQIIDRSSVGGQAELAASLSERGFAVTQASVSRDLDELGIVKHGGRYVRPLVKGGSVTDLGAVTFETSGDNLIVGRCSSGLASAVTVRIDRMEMMEIVGTIAGDDTIFIAVRDADEQPLVVQRLRDLFI